VRHNAALEDGTTVTLARVRDEAQSVLAEIRRETGDEAFRNGHYDRAAKHLERLTAAREFETFLTLAAYEEID
jgi:malate synthase